MSASPWDDLPPYEQERIAALPLEECLRAMFDHAPKASSADALAVLQARGVTKKQVKDIRDAWKRDRVEADADADAPPAVPTREAIIRELRQAIDLKDSRATDRWARALNSLEKAGRVDAERATTEDWDRLSDLQAGVLIALTRKLNGEPETTADAAWLRRLR